MFLLIIYKRNKQFFFFEKDEFLFKIKLCVELYKFCKSFSWGFLLSLKCKFSRATLAPALSLKTFRQS